MSWLTEKGVLAMNPLGMSRPRDFRGLKAKFNAAGRGQDIHAHGNLARAYFVKRYGPRW
jgi:hypothetical protein